ncbi:MAG TPA: class A beta-lactamase [Aliidongia sp.]|uniref:class A beta-lactamase n=1 Tax=Aliidongia sp. TaxID=1914230 RepID=UPI002DDD9574|nr:class A beta-lactamase [Aliidongia sp.]HEV2673617.1 class A beta-lactamase [Aliidongia sp.]
MLTRRQLMKNTSAAAAGAVLTGGLSRLGRAADGGFGWLAGRLAAIEAQSGGRLGVAVLDTGTGVRSGHRAGERFPMCSTFKLLAVGAVLTRVDTGREQLDRRVRFEASDVVVNSPITKDRTGGDGMTLGELCAAAIDYSDNTAGNLLLRSFGGPAALTAYARSLGDLVTRLDRIEPDLNEATPGDPRDVTTPVAMLANLRRLAQGDFLSASSRDQLVRWLQANKTGDARLRAGLPPGWRVADKTGSGERGSTNDVGLVWPPDGAPILVSIYLTNTKAPPEHRNATLAAVGRAVAEAVLA